MADIDICNRALAEIGARSEITSLADATPQAQACNLFYNALRKQLLRAAPWGFARRTLLLTELGRSTDDPNIVPYPWYVMYTHPSDCLKMRYILPPPIPPTVDGAITPPAVGTVLPGPWCGPSRAWRYLISVDTSTSPDRKVILSNVLDAYGVYTMDVTETSLFDPLYENALSMALASKLVMALTGNVGLKNSFWQLANEAVIAARVADGNESIPTTEHMVDWIVGRGVWGATGGMTGFSAIGDWYWGYDLNWGM